jgi:hypothetical protein
MRLPVCLLVVAALSVPARADDVTFRGNYWRDRNTRILQPLVDLNKEFGSGTLIGAHYLLDTITSASVAAGAVRDQPFTELRHETGFRVGQRIKQKLLLSTGYSYSSESDYWAHLVNLSGALDLFQRNTTLSLSIAYGHDTVGRRMGPTVFSTLGQLDKLYIVFGWNQLLTPTLSFAFSHDLGISGFGSADNGFQANPYRPVNLGGNPTMERLPFQRLRHALSLAVSWMIPLGGRVVPYLMFRPSYRFYADDWSVLSHTVELRTHLPLGPIELRLTGRLFRQGQASFWNDLGDGVPFYPSSDGRPCSGCLLQSSTLGYYTADPKLSAMNSYFIEIRVLLKLKFLRRLSRWLSDGLIEASYGHYFNDAWAHTTWGDAEVAGLTFVFPL